MRYYSYLLLSILLKPIGLFALNFYGQSYWANLMANVLILNQALLALGSTQIHKRILRKKGSLKTLTRISFLESIVYMPIMCLVIGIFFNSGILIAFSIAAFPYEKILEDMQRYFIYSGDQEKFALLALIRSSVIVLMFITMAQVDAGEQIFYVYPLLLGVFVYFIVDWCGLRKIKTSYFNYLRNASLSSFAGLLIGILAVLSVQADKYYAQRYIANIAEYLLSYQATSILLVFFSVTYFNKARKYVVYDLNAYFKIVLGPMISFIALVLISVLCLYIFELPAINLLQNLRLSNEFYFFLMINFIIVIIQLVNQVAYEAVYWNRSINLICAIDFLFVIMGGSLFVILQSKIEGFIFILIAIMAMRAILYLAYAYYIVKPRRALTNEAL